MGFDVTRVPEVPYSIFLEDRAQIADVKFNGHDLRFLVGNPNDFIQKKHLSGSLHEIEELALIEKHYVPGTTFVDIGSNVGNHAVWAAKCLAAPKVIAFEPVLGQHTLLCSNVALNDLQDVVKVCKIALSSSSGRIRIPGSFDVTKDAGSRRVSATGLGEEVKMSTGDRELSEVGAMFIKIDVESHEIDVLEGLRRTIEVRRPKLFIEVDDVNEDAFRDWLVSSGYEILESHKRFEINCNYIAAPIA